MAKHTPGPWRVQGTRIRDCEPGIDCIATMQVSNQPNWDADARLISAAPELLSAIQFLIDASVPMSRQQSECWKALEAAIAKATGE